MDNSDEMEMHDNDEMVIEVEASAAVSVTDVVQSGRAMRQRRPTEETHPNKHCVDSVVEPIETDPPIDDLPWGHHTDIEEETPYGLTDPSVLVDFSEHVADSIWRIYGPWPRGQSAFIRRLRCQSRPREFAGWRTHIPPPNVHVDDGSWLWIARQTGLTGLLDFDFGMVDHALISAFVERWHPETNSFHFPWGEITITLHDVAILMGLPIEGHEVAHSASANECLELFEYLFGTRTDYVYPGELDMLMDLRRGRVHSLEFFHHVVSMIAFDDPPECVAAGFLWHAMSTSLFVDKSTNTLHTRLLPLFDNWGRVVETAWGTGTLAFLYRNLGEATRVGVAQMAGCSYLLQMWIWTYFVYFPGNPNPLPGAENDERRALRYRIDRTRLQTDDTAIYYRRILNEYRPEDVCWTPYSRVDLDRQYPTSRYRGTIRFMDVYEPYHPDRCVRQWGRLQSRPLDVIRPTKYARPASLKGRATYFLSFDDSHYGWDRVQDHICPYILQSPVVVSPWDVDDEFLDWFLQISHPYVSRTASVQTRIIRAPLPAVDFHRRLQLIRAYVRTVIEESVHGDWAHVYALCGLDNTPVAPPMSRASQNTRESSRAAESKRQFPSIWEQGELLRMAEE